MTHACLILGAGGRVGRLLRGVWPRTNADVQAVFQSRHAGPGIDLVAPFDQSLAEAIAAPVGVVVVLSGQTYGDSGAMDANTDYALTGLNLAARIACPRVILCSSAAVYQAEAGHGPFRETDAHCSDRPYGRAKLAMEQAAWRWYGTTPAPPEVTCLRMANVAGADMLADSCRRATPEAPLMLDRFADGRSPRRSYLSPTTFARVIADLAQKPVDGDFRIANLAEPGPPLEMESVLRALAAADVCVPWAWQVAPPRAIPEMALELSEIQAFLPECSRLRAAVNATGVVDSWLTATGGAL